MTIKAQRFRMLLRFPKKYGMCGHYGITLYFKAAFYPVSLSGRRFFQNLVEREANAVEEVPGSRTTEDVLRKWGCNDSLIMKIFQRHTPLRKAVATKLESKLELLSKLGLTSSDLVKMIYDRPRIFSCPINQNFDERLDRLQCLFGSKELLIKAIIRNPSFLIYNLREVVEPVFTMYEQMGISKVDLVSMILIRPTLIPRTKMCEEKLEYIRKSGITKESKLFKYVVTIIGVSRIATLREKVANLEKFGFSEDEVLQLFARAPFLMTQSVDKIQRNMTFVVGVMKLPASIVLQYPNLITANLENILKPRVLLGRKIQEMDLEPQLKGPTVFRALRMTEERFLNAFVRCHEKEVAQQLLAYYQASKGIKRLAASSKKFPLILGFPF